MLTTNFMVWRAKSAWSWLLKRLLLSIGSIFIADRLIIDHAGGLSIALFVASLGVMVTCANALRAARRAQILAIALLSAGLVSLINDLNLLSFCCGLISLTAFAIILTSSALPDWPDLAGRAAFLPLSGPVRLIVDLSRIYRDSRSKRRRPIAISFLLTWGAPVLLFGMFLALLTDANPVIELWLKSIDLRMRFGHLDPIRAGFWIVILLFTWPLLHIPSFVRKPKSKARPIPTGVNWEACGLFREAAILRSLILLNALFALQSALDVTYLWAGVSLPTGMTYANYAHRGAYPLMVTALLAAAIVLITMRPGGPGETSRGIRTLVLIWTAQTVLLVVSSILRLDLYVAVYTLTYWRMAALIWMALVAIGLALIFIQVFGRRSGRWLVTMNAASLALVLYSSSLINFPEFIARYNFDHSREGGGSDNPIDIFYLLSLGPQALPVIDQLLPLQAVNASNSRCCHYIEQQRAALAAAHREAQRDWRSWSLQEWRLSRYLDMKDAEHADAIGSPGPGQ